MILSDARIELEAMLFAQLQSSLDGMTFEQFLRARLGIVDRQKERVRLDRVSPEEYSCSATNRSLAVVKLQERRSSSLHERLQGSLVG
jgi:hypothetical protein